MHWTSWGRPDITIERVAINIDDARIADNEGNQPVDVPVVERTSCLLVYTSDESDCKKLQEEGIPASVSQTAGTFVCNHLFYGLMHELEKHDTKMKGGFIHIPFYQSKRVIIQGNRVCHFLLFVKG